MRYIVFLLTAVFATYMSQEGGSALQKPAVEILSAVVTYPNWPSTLAGGPMIFKFQVRYMVRKLVPWLHYGCDSRRYNCENVL